MTSGEETSGEREPFGWHLVLDLHGCNPAHIADPEHIAEYARQLVTLIGMKPYGDPIITHFGHATPKTAGYTLAQMIETSLISGHFSEDRGSAHLDVFSCCPFDALAVVGFSRDWFGAKMAVQRVLVRA